MILKMILITPIPQIEKENKLNLCDTLKNTMLQNFPTSDIIPQVYAIAPTNYSDRKIGTLGKKICILVEPETLSPVQVASTGILNITSTNTTPYGVYCDSNNIATSATGIVLADFLTTNSIVNTGANNAGGGNSGTPLQYVGVRTEVLVQSFR